MAIEKIMEVLGLDYAIAGGKDLLLATASTRHPTEIAKLRGRRLVVCTETDSGRKFSESTVKMLTSRGRIDARRMQEDPWDFLPSHTLFLQTNHRPKVSGTDHGIWRRLRIIPFTQKFWDRTKGGSGPPEWEADRQLATRLQDEHEGILAWLVRGCLDWQQHGLGQPPEVTAATGEYRAEMDVVARFIDECCERGHRCTVRASDLLERRSLVHLDGAGKADRHEDRHLLDHAGQHRRLRHYQMDEQRHVVWRHPDPHGGDPDGGPAVGDRGKQHAVHQRVHRAAAEVRQKEKGG